MGDVRASWVFAKRLARRRGFGAKSRGPHAWVPGFRGLGETLRSRPRPHTPLNAGARAGGLEFVRTRSRTRAESRNQEKAEGKGRS